MHDKRKEQQTVKSVRMGNNKAQCASVRNVASRAMGTAAAINNPQVCKQNNKQWGGKRNGRCGVCNNGNGNKNKRNGNARSNPTACICGNGVI